LVKMMMKTKIDTSAVWILIKHYDKYTGQLINWYDVEYYFNLSGASGIRIFNHERFQKDVHEHKVFLNLSSKSIRQKIMSSDSANCYVVVFNLDVKPTKIYFGLPNENLLALSKERGMWDTINKLVGNRLSWNSD